MTTPHEAALNVRADSEPNACPHRAVATKVPGRLDCRCAKTDAHAAFFEELPTRGGTDFALGPDLSWCCIALQPAGLQCRVEPIRAGAGGCITGLIAEHNPYGADPTGRRRGATQPNR